MNTDGDGVVTMAQDLLCILLPFLGDSDSRTLFELSSVEGVLENKDTGVQKRGYKILSKLVDSGKIQVTPENFIQQLEGKVDGVSAAAKKVGHRLFSEPAPEVLQDRMHLLALLVNMLPNTSLHLLPSLIPEAVLATKEPSEKARIEAFDLIVTMGKKMKDGGLVKRNLLEGMDENDATESTFLTSVFVSSRSTSPNSTAPASLEEYFTMIAGGLAGATPHMISATITAISRLVFEFKGPHFFLTVAETNVDLIL
jgi:ribosomal RNA-processing protein 12